MLVLQVRKGESFKVYYGGDSMDVKVIDCRGTHYKFGFEANEKFKIVRHKLLNKVGKNVS